MKAFDEFLKATLEQAGHEARADGSTSIQAEHLLLAMATQSTTDVGRFLVVMGLGHGALRAALDREFAQALSSAGVSVDAATRRPASSASGPVGDIGTSVRHALERGMAGLRGKPRPGHLLPGVLQAEVGSVPRALALAGIDRAALLEQVRQMLLG
ncbi:MAG TPA: Clp protease N-terminal domain-containing protein [Polyangiaceae bacterium]|nr:Clp protease N-terminal domain-containing protein [Polyangiaceae bacterium]